MDTVRRKDCLLPLREIKVSPRNARTHSQAQIRQIADSIQVLGFGSPVLVDECLTLIAGHGRFKAAELLGLGEIPAVQLIGLSEAQKRALALADNKIADNAGWDRGRLAIELPENPSGLPRPTRTTGTPVKMARSRIAFRSSDGSLP